MFRALSLSLALSLGAATPALAADTYAVDAVHSSAVFKIQHLGVSDFYGRLNDIEGTFVLDDENPAKSVVDIQVKAGSVDTHNDKRDEHLRSPDFFNAKQFPVITFVGKSFKKTGDTWSVTGDFTLHGVTKRITVPFTVVGEGEDPWGGYRRGASATFVVDRTDYGMAYMAGGNGLGDEVTLMVSLEGIRQ